MPAKSARRFGKRPRLRNVILGTISTLVVLALALGGFVAWSVFRAFPDTEGTLDVVGLEHEVTVQRDAQGIPTVTAETSHDLFFAQGLVHAQDRFWEMDFRRHMTSGRLSELFGASQLDTDKFLRTLDWHGIAEQEIEALPDRERAYYEAYADGVNAYLAEREGGALALEYTVLGLQNSDYEPAPWTPVDSAAWLKAMAWDLRTNIEDETTRALLTQRLDDDAIEDLYPEYPFDEHPVILAEDPDGSGIAEANIPEPSGNAADDQPVGQQTSAETSETAPTVEAAPLLEVIDEVDALMPDVGEGIGSNSWVVSGDHTESGLPLLANDPHLGASLPSVWHQMHLRCAEVSEECPYDASGFGFSGLPGIVIGHNQDIAWGFTNLTTDVADLYVERVEGDEYWHDGEKRPVETRQETLEVAGGNDVSLDVRSTHHGPILSDLQRDFTMITINPPTDAVEDAEIPPGEFELSLRWTALDVTTTAQAIFTLNRAENFGDLRQAASEFEVPGQNLVYADRQGNIGYQAPGKLPIRGAGDGFLPQPGWDSAYDWQGTIPFDQHPVSYNPDSGYIVTANNAIVTDDYEHFLSRDWDYGHRAARIVEELEAKLEAGSVTVDDMAELHMDNESPVADALQEAYASIDVDDAQVQEAIALLADWDGQNDPDSAGAAFANVLWNHVTHAMVRTQETDIPRDDQSRYAVFFKAQLEDPESPWWGDSQEQLLTDAAVTAYAELTDEQGSNSQDWNWGDLHALTLTHESFGTSGIGPIEALFNRGPYPVGGGSGVVNATGWDLDEGYATTTVPSMRMVVDVDDWDNSVWHNLTGTSGHAFHPNYTDQAQDWADGEQYPWNYSADVLEQHWEDTLVLQPTGD
ncbi:MAG: penicillin acylase family protein [Yaniella sp.]|uniref:penicillin acylase family protein n=1 Tax=Yaniella sp. TaxID=2773929 RepID=UPI0026497D76|nr:penicillin acylase family protein [Yaniella sp.]MDN5818425.1 penicillin acylase family protein [Yaniella sp.]